MHPIPRRYKKIGNLKRRYLRGSRCECCYSTNNLTVDHIVPIVRGGTNHVTNLRVLCQPCNIDKGHRLDEEWPLWQQQKALKKKLIDKFKEEGGSSIQARLLSTALRMKAKS